MSVIGILSGKGGVGKTTVVANLGVSLTKNFNQNVVIVDANINAAHLGMHLGIYEDMPVTLRDVLQKKAPLSYAIHVHPTLGVRILPAPMSSGGVNLEKIKSVIRELRGIYNVVILDTAPGLGKDFISIQPAIDSSYVITTPDLPSLSDSLKTIHLLERFKKKVGGIVVNRVRNKKYELLNGEIENACKVPIVGVLPEDEKVPESIQNGIPVVLSSPNSRVAIEFKRLAARIAGVEYKPAGVLYRLRQLVDSILQPKPMPKMTPTPIQEVGELPKMKKPKKIKRAELEEEASDAQNIEKRIREELKEEIKAEVLKKIKERLKGEQE